MHKIRGKAQVTDTNRQWHGTAADRKDRGDVIGECALCHAPMHAHDVHVYKRLAPATALCRDCGNAPISPGDWHHIWDPDAMPSYVCSRLQTTAYSRLDARMQEEADKRPRPDRLPRVTR